MRVNSRLSGLIRSLISDVRTTLTSLFAASLVRVLWLAVFVGVFFASTIYIAVIRPSMRVLLRVKKSTIDALHLRLSKKHSLYRKYHESRLANPLHKFILASYSGILCFGLISTVWLTLAAPDQTDVWNLAVPAEYNISEGLEFSGSTVRLAPQNYTPDSSTRALFHLDELAGPVVEDSSSYGNDGNLVGGTFVAGSLYNGLQIASSQEYVSVPDSPSLSLASDSTIEAWTKLDAPLSASTNDRRQTVVSKGDYGLYYDNETGKVTYELANAAATTWSQTAGNGFEGSWETNGKRAVSASTVMGGNVYAGLGNQLADAEVWMWNGSAWTKIGGDGISGSWSDQTFEGVNSIINDGTNVYVGLSASSGDADVWMWNGSTWTKIGGDGANSSWQIGTFEYIGAMSYFGGNVYAGLGNGANDAEVWRWNGSAWTKIGGDSLNSGWTTNYEYVGALTNDGANLYAGIGVSADEAEVWRWNGSAWTKIGGDSLNSGWTTGIETVRSLAYISGTLYAGLGDSAGDADVWSWNGSSWTQIGGDGLASSWAASTYEGVYAIGTDGTNLYAGLGTTSGEGEVWRYAAGVWSQVGGDGLNGSWASAFGDIVYTLSNDGSTVYAGIYDAAGGGYLYSWNGTSWTAVGGQYINKSWGYFGQGSVETLQNSGDYMYAGIGSAAGSAQVWRFDGSAWDIVGGQGVNGSWAANTYEQISSMNSHEGKLYVGLGTTANDAELWEWDGAIWTQIGGDSLFSGWTTGYEEVNALASYNGSLYAGLGNSNNDAEVWRWNGSIWTKIGGDSLPTGWTTNYDRVSSLAVFRGELVAGLGAGSGEAEVWRWNGSTWTKFGGDAVNSSWGAYEQIEALIPYDNKLYAGLGNTVGDGEVWEWDGSAWQQIGGDDVNNSWTDGTYERARTLAVYNGSLIAGLGSNTGEGEVWAYELGVWEKIGGNGVGGSWGNAIEEVEALGTYRGKLYAGLGNSANVDAVVWSYGDNGFLQSTTDTFDTNWRHIAATYDGSAMRIYIDGALDASTTKLLTIPNSAKPLLIGNGYGGREYGKPLASFEGILDEIRISSVARTEFNASQYSQDPQTVEPADSARASNVWNWDTFAALETTNGGTVNYRLSSNNGTTWQYWDGSDWAVSNTLTDTNSAAVIDAHIFEFPVTFSGILWQAVLQGDGTQQVVLDEVTIESTSDSIAPTLNASNIVALKANAGSALAENAWTNGGSPYFSWDAGADAESGIVGYCAYLGTDSLADPVTTKGLLGASPILTGGNCEFIVGGEELDTATPGILASELVTSTDTYYLNLRAIDLGGNVSATTEQFGFRFDDTPPENPAFVSAPSGFINTKDIVLSWQTTGPSAPSDDHSGLAGLQYRIGATDWYGDVHSGTGDNTDLLLNDGSYSTIDPTDFDNLFDGINTVYFRTWDQAGNVTSSYTTATVKLNTSGAPSEPLNLEASPTSNTLNAFSFSWDEPTSYIGDVANITYCYTVNVLPSEENCTYTGGGVTSLGAGPYATEPGVNTFYLVARDESNNVNYGSYSSVSFNANTTAPGIPINTDIVDVSIKATSNWRLALTWEEPTSIGIGIDSYRIFRSTDEVTFNEVGASSSTTYIDANLTQQPYFYYVIACDSTSNCSAESSTVSETPTGKFTTAATLVSQPVASDVTTRKALISWSTDRPSDSRISIGTSSGQYSSAEVANSDQVTAHTIALDNLSAGTTYYYVARWTDEDGNIGASQERTFKTSPAPTVKEVTVVKTGLTNATIQFTSRNATKIDLVYGKSESFGGVESINTSLSESTYGVELVGLDDGSKYFFKMISYDSDGNAYDGNIFSLTTPPRPRITNLRFQPIEGEPTSTQSVTWSTNVASNSVVTYGKIGSIGADAQDNQLTTNHEMIIRNLADDSEYFLVAQSRDESGNLAVSDRQTFRTALDTRPPKVSDIVVETSIRGTGAEARGQIVVSWRTDEPSTSQVAYGEGSTIQVFNNRTSEDSGLGTEHIVIVNDLPTSRVYSIQPVAKDRSGNEGAGEIQTAIIGRGSDSVLTVILDTLQGVFGF